MGRRIEISIEKREISVFSHNFHPGPRFSLYGLSGGKTERTKTSTGLNTIDMWKSDQSYIKWFWCLPIIWLSGLSLRYAVVNNKREEWATNGQESFGSIDSIILIDRSGMEGGSRLELSSQNSIMKLSRPADCILGGYMHYFIGSRRMFATKIERSQYSNLFP